MDAHVREQESHACAPAAPDLASTWNGDCAEAPAPLPQPPLGHADGELLRLRRWFRLRHSAWVRLWMACHAKEDVREKASMAEGSLNWEVWNALTDSLGFTAADDAYAELSPIIEKIIATPATTPAGLQVKAEAILAEIFLPHQYTDVAEQDEDRGVTLMRQIIRELGEMSVETSPSPQTCLPILHLIDEWYRARFMANTVSAKLDEDEWDKIISRAEEIEDVLEASKPSTVDEAIAYIGLAKIGIWRHLVGGTGSFTYDMFAALLDGAADVLRANFQDN